MIYGFARKHGLQDADAIDVTQEVLHAVSRKPSDGWNTTRLVDRFEDGYLRLSGNEINTWFGRQRSPVVGIGQASTNDFDLLISDDEASAIWECEHQQRLFEWAARRVRSEVQESTWQAFWQSTVENKNGKQIASELRISVAAVYLSKSRVMSRLKELIRLASSDGSVL